ncbi:MAG TPA: tetratricopeptide repeat protein [Acidimicrobiales bacterium]|nr:tetratricopeptide repeat protein [Acidimicrobiales bacterium]
MGEFSTESGPSVLPVALDSFVAREAEMAAVQALLGRSRLVTITGPAGVGKTRLAVEAAIVAGDDYDDGVVFAPLAGTCDPGLVPQSVASALSLAEQPGRVLADTVVDHLRDRRMLLVLDNCEHVVSGAARLVDTLLRSCAGLVVLATSQEPLSIAGEVVWALSALAVPGTGGPVEASPAVRLFCDRAAAIRPGFALTADTAPAVAEICRRLDGVALAIELAAARVAVLRPAEIAARLSDRFKLLSGGSRLGPARHRSLQAALDWSHELCSAPERALLRRLSLFPAGATLDAAVEVCAGGDVPPAEVFDTMAALVAKSLVVAETSGVETRFRLLETVRLYARDRLDEAGELEDALRRHASWYTDLAESAEVHLTGRDQGSWLRRIEIEHDNVRAALEWAIGGGDAELAQRLSGALTLWWRVRGYFSEGRSYLDEALAVGPSTPDGVRAKALWGVGFLATMLGDTDQSAACLEEALSLYRRLGDRKGSARSLLLLADCRVHCDASSAMALLEESAGLAREVGDEWCLAHARALCGLALVMQGDPVAARPVLDEAVAVARRSHDDQGLRMAMAVLGQLALGQGDYDVAQQAFEEVAVVTRDLGEVYGTAVALIGLGEIALARGDYETARCTLEGGERAGRRTANPDVIVTALALRAELAQVQDDIAAARRLYDEAVAFASDSGHVCISAVRGLGELAAAEGDTRRAARLFEKALGMAEGSNNDRSVAAILFDMAELARSTATRERALTLHHKALDLRTRMGDCRGVVESLEALAGLAADAGEQRADYGARLLGAAAHLRGDRGYARSAAQHRTHEADLERLRACMGAEELDTALALGAELSVEEAVSYATKGRRGRSRPTTGLESLTRAERDVAALAAAGLSNPEIGVQLFIGTWTVKGHLKRVFAKLGVSSRVELARLWMESGN